MALDTYANLQTAVANYMHRADLTGSISDFIVLAEARIKAKLEMRLQNVAATISTIAGQAYADAPVGLINVHSMSIQNIAPTIDYVTPSQYALENYDDRTGSPSKYTIIGSRIYFGPKPDAAYNVSIVYEAEYTPLSASNTSNIVLSKWPNVYLWGSLKEAANYSRNFEYEAVCENNFQTAVNDANILEWHSGGPMRMRSDTTTP